MTIFQNVKKEDVEKLVPKGFCKLEPKTIYEEFRCSKDGVTLILFTSGKLLLQGRDEVVEQVAKEIKKLKLGEQVKPEAFRRESGWMIGSDETLKGDTFGGIVVAAVKADDEIRSRLMELGVADSKKLSDKEIVVMAERIKRVAPCEIKSLLPEEFNRKKEKITLVLDHLHQACAKSLGSGKHIVDKYPGCSVGDIMEEKAESKYVEVAAASVLARAAGLHQLDYLSHQAGFTLPKGSTHVKGALLQLLEDGVDLQKFVKMGFRNVKGLLARGRSAV